MLSLQNGPRNAGIFDRQNRYNSALDFTPSIDYISGMKLLTHSNPKLEKGRSLGYLSFVLHLAPSRLSGYNVCPMATVGCAAACLNTAGRGGIFAGKSTLGMTGAQTVDAVKNGSLVNRIQDARIRRTKMFFENRDAFMVLLVKEIRSGIRLAEKHGLIPVFRLNGTSDIRWEVTTVGTKVDSTFMADNVMTLFPTIQFYDYTKIANRRHLPLNYHLTFSLAENNDADALTAIQRGMNVAVVFKTAPETFFGRPVIDGDKTDLRFLDVSGAIVGLKAKGKAKSDTSGFVR